MYKKLRKGETLPGYIYIYKASFMKTTLQEGVNNICIESSSLTTLLLLLLGAIQWLLNFKTNPNSLTIREPLVHSSLYCTYFICICVQFNFTAFPNIHFLDCKIVCVCV